MKARFLSVPPVIWISLVLMFIWIIFAKGFFSLSNFSNIAVQASPLLIVAIGETIVILTEGIDLSVGWVLGFCSVATAFLLKIGMPIPIAIMGGIFMGAMFGFCNGILVARGGLSPFIASLGVGNIAFGLGLIFTGGLSVAALDRKFRFIAEGKIVGIPLPVIIAAIVFLVMWIMMNRTAFGRNVYGLGGNKQALRLAGTNIKRATTWVFVAAGTLYGVAGVVVAARTASGNAGAGLDWEFDALAATLIGGTSFEEGRGSINKTILGVLLIVVLRNGLNIAGVVNMYQFLLIGTVVVAAIVLDVLYRKTFQMQGAYK